MAVLSIPAPHTGIAPQTERTTAVITSLNLLKQSFSLYASIMMVVSYGFQIFFGQKTRIIRLTQFVNLSFFPY